MLLEKSLWLSLLLILIQGIVIYFAGYFGGYKVAKWRFGKEISIKHFDQIKEGVIQPILRILNRDIRDILNKANAIIVLEAQDLYGEEKDREKIKIGNKYFLSINNSLRSFLELNDFFGEQVDKGLFNDLENHFNEIKNCFETFLSLLNNYTKSYLSFTKGLQDKIELQCKEIGFIQDELSCQILRGSNLRYVNTPEIAFWVFKKLFEMNVNKLEIEYFGDATSLLESGRFPFASGKKEEIEKLREFSYDLTKGNYQEIINLNQKLIELSKMKVELINDFQDLKSLNKLSGSCKYIEV